MAQIDSSFELLQDGNVSVLVLLPELNNVQWGDIDAIGTEVLNSMSTQKKPYIIVDLSPLSYMGSAMVALIVRVWKAAQAKDGKISVVCSHDGVKEVLKLASLDKVWSIVKTREEARSALGLKGTSNLTSSSKADAASNAGWIVAGFLMVACIGLAVVAFNPGMLGNAVVDPQIPLPAATSSVAGEASASEPAIVTLVEINPVESSTTLEANTTDGAIPSEEMTSPEAVVNPLFPEPTTSPMPAGASGEESTSNPFAPPES